MVNFYLTKQKYSSVTLAESQKFRQKQTILYDFVHNTASQIRTIQSTIPDGFSFKDIIVTPFPTFSDLFFVDD